MGAWIETRAATEFADNVNVASYMGAWIETLEEPQSDEPDIVASYMGAWIETSLPAYNCAGNVSRILHGCVD